MLEVAAADGEKRTFEATLVSFGNPHAVIFLDSDVSQFEVEKWGPALERHSQFPDRSNIEFVSCLNKESVKARVWERGAGETLSCGSGACAVAVASITDKKTSSRKVAVSLPGGSLSLEWNAEGEVLVEGPATTVFEGTIHVQVPLSLRRSAEL